MNANITMAAHHLKLASDAIARVFEEENLNPSERLFAMQSAKVYTDLARKSLVDTSEIGPLAEEANNK